MLIDLHTHTYPRSDDSFMSPDELVEAAKACGLDGICITEHDYFWDPTSIRALSGRHNFLVLPGCEVNTDGGHMLVFGLGQYVFGMHKETYLRELVDGAGGALIAAHPYRRRYRPEAAHQPDAYAALLDGACSEPFFSHCDALEVLNGRGTNGENSFAMDVSLRLGLGMVGGSDSHRSAHLGRIATRFHNKVSSIDDLIREIKAGRCTPVAMDGGQSIGPGYPIGPASEGEQADG